LIANPAITDVRCQLVNTASAMRAEFRLIQANVNRIQASNKPLAQ
jgi:hypothetical protein